MSILVKPEARIKREKAGFPEGKKFERTGENTFTVHAEGGNRFEGTFNPKVSKYKGTGKIIFSNVGVCIRKCLNKSSKCDSCFKFSKYEEDTK